MSFSSLVSDFDALIFDCDGTLTDSMPLHYICWKDVLLKFGIHFSEDRFYSMAGMPSDKIVEILSAEQGVSVSAAQVGEEKEEAFVQYLPQLQPLDWVCQIARDHQDKLLMSVASGGTRPIVAAQLDVVGVSHLFPHVVTAEDTVKHKPEPDVFLEAALRMGVSPQRCLVFEDSKLGFRAALSASMAYVDVTCENPKPRRTLED